MGLLTTLMIGFVVGLVARAVKPGIDSMGIVLTTLLGMCGAFLARFLGLAFGFYSPAETTGWIASVLGAVILLVLFGLVRGRSRRPRVM